MMSTAVCTPEADFSSIPIIDFSLASSPSTKPIFISQLRHALINIGFLYLSNPPIDATIIEALRSYIPKFFALPQEEKKKLKMINSPYFLGYTSLGEELTRGMVDHKETFYLGTEYKMKEVRENEELQDYWKMYGEPLVRIV
jgi:isopenicillin N synthase-like dioxygenase